MHCQTQHDMAKGVPGQEGDGEGRGNDTKTYRMVFPEKVGPRPCPVEGCSFRVAMQTAMQMQFFYWNIQDTVVILEKGNLSHPR